MFFDWFIANIRTLELQLLVSPEGGSLVEGQRNTWTDGEETWQNIRIPKNPGNEAYFKEYELSFLLERHWLALGTTGWDWINKRSLGLGFDFDSAKGHASGLEPAQLDEINQRACHLDYVEAHKSKSGHGVHLWIFFKDSPVVANHNEHAAIARALLGKMSADAEFDFQSRLDTCGSVLWTAHRDTAPSGFESIKRAERLLTSEDIPSNWRDHLDVVTHKISKVRVLGINDDGTEVADDSLSSMVAAKTKTTLDAQHKAIIEALELVTTAYWIPDHHLLQTHTAALKQIHEQLGLRGFFDTLSSGTDLSKPNCFCIPEPDGVFKVYRFGKGTPEHQLWQQDGGWTQCYYNRPPRLVDAAVAFGGIENTGAYYFTDTKQAEDVVKALGAKLLLPDGNKYEGRPTILRRNKDGRLIVELEQWEGDTNFKDWLSKKKKWVKIFNINVDINEQEDYTRFDAVIRSVKTVANIDAGWRINDKLCWVRHPSENVKHALKAIDQDTDISIAMGYAVLRQWTLVNIPFAEEYPGGRQWNLGAPQLKFKPTDEEPYHPYWDRILTHCGSELNSHVSKLKWCKEWGIFSGKDYLTAWIACLIRYPFEPLPYLFLYGDQNQGKSILHEAITLLMTRGVEKADRALTNQNDFNGELANAVLAVVDEVNVTKAGSAVYEKIKDWTTSRYISIHSKGVQVYQQRNCLHFIQTANYRDHCPVFPGDTRIVVMYVPPLIEEIPKFKLLELLIAEAPHFMATLMHLPLPDSMTRLRLPVIETASKAQEAATNRTALDIFLDTYYQVPGEKIEFGDFFLKFSTTLTSSEMAAWPRRRVQMAVSNLFSVGSDEEGVLWIGNLSKTKTPQTNPRYILTDRGLVYESSNLS